MAQTVRFTADLGRLQTEVSRSQKAFDLLSGGSLQAAANITAIQQASGGTVSALQAIKIGNQAAALSLASTAAEFERVTRAGRVVALISPVINDVSSAISELGLASANLSFRRLDQLGLSVSEVRDKMRELQSQNESLSDSQAFLEASIISLESKGGDLLNSVEAQASGFEKLAVAISDARAAAAKGPIIVNVQQAAGLFAEDVNALFGLGNTELLDSALLNKATRASTTDIALQINDVRKALKDVNELFKLDPDGYKDLRDVAIDIAETVALTGNVTDEQDAAVQALIQSYYTLRDAAQQTYEARLKTESIDEAAKNREATIAEAQTGFNDTILSNASKNIDTIGVERAIAVVKEQKALVDQAITDLINSSVTDPDEISLRLADIGTEIQTFFEDISKQGNIAIDFGLLGESADSFNQAFIDFLPGVDNLRDRLIDLQTELAFTGSATADQAAELDYLTAAASIAGGEAASLQAIVGDLGIDFLATNEEAAALVDQLYIGATAYSVGQVSAQEYAGVVSAVGERLLALAQDAGVATGSILELVQAMSGLSGTTDFNIGVNRGRSIVGSTRAAQQERDRERVRREAEAAAKRAAREQESAAKRAARELEQGAKKARQELESALKSVPGLFGRSQVTQSQLDRAKSGLPQNFADDYLRRLQDEVFNKHDWADVSIDEAKQSLRDLGIQVADDNKIAFEQFAEAWESSVLFADEANLRFINQDAVQLQLDLQEKAKQGQENIYKLFGIAVDEAVSSVAGGISGGGGGIAASIPTAAQLIPANTDLTTIPTLGGVSVAVDIEAIRGQLNDLTVKPTFDLSEINNAQLTIRSTLGIESFAAVIEKIESTRATLSVRTDLHTESFAAVLEKVGSTKQSILVDAELNPDSNVGETIKQALAADIGATRFDGEVITPIADGLLRAINTEFAVRRADFRREGESLADVIKSALGDAIGVTEWTDGAAVAPIADGLITAINTQVRARKDAIGREGGGVAQLIKAGINESISTVDWKDGQVVAPIATGLITSINTQFRASRDLFVREGQSLSTFIMSGLSNSFQVTDPNGNTDTSIALGLVSALNSQFDASQNFFYAAGQTPASALLDGFRGSFAGGPEASAALVSPLLEGITTGIRANQQQFQQRGGTIARALMSGFTREFDSETLRNTLVAAGETMGMYLEVGILSRIRGGALVEAIGAQVLADIADTVEGTQP